MHPDQMNGILSNWNKIEADIRVGLHEDFGKSKDIQDILDIIHTLQETAHTVSPLRQMFNTHLTDMENPHNITITLDDLDLLSTLYNLYIMKFGMEMTITEFGRAMVNIRKFATRADITNSTNEDAIINVDVMDFMIENHDLSPEAHADLFRHRLPGKPFASPPVEVFEPSMAMSNMFNVERACSMNYHDINGRVKTVPENTLPIDYSYGTPASPIFGPHRNIMLNSKELTDVVLHGAVRNENTDLFIITAIDDPKFLLLQELNNFGSHGFIDTLPEEISGVNNYYIYVYPLERRRLVISAISNGAEIVGSAIFDCDLVESQSEGAFEKMHVTFNDLPNGWFRCCIAFDTSIHNITSFNVDTLLDIDPFGSYDTNYQGRVCNSMCFWQHQITKTVLPAPPIFTDNVAITVLGTKVRRDFTDLFNYIRGSLVFRYLSPLSEIFGTTSTMVRLGHNGDQPTTAIRVGTNEINPSRNRIITYNINNEVLKMIDSQPYDTESPFAKRVAFTYGLGYQGYGFTDQHPEVFATSIDDVLKQMITFFEDIYDGTVNYAGVRILQVPQDIVGDDDTDDTLVTGELANTAQYRINMDVDVLELGYDSVTDKYLDGYLLNFRYYTLFGSAMNLEFLLDQYIPK